MPDADGVRDDLGFEPEIGLACDGGAARLTAAERDGRLMNTHDLGAEHALLRGVLPAVKRVRRPHDLIVRFGGDEFVYVLCGHQPADLHERFAQVAADLTRSHGASVTVGFVHPVAGETA